ncbi:hypothetical protein BU26DRAFT_293097 [Trematosphaeria pertusa]|uniref:Uncharacterized protein n=1 Tax=Trematosphaeria pertusa TaxID=390896 RepID=A0A6A6IHX6_9PLEO|nr:uncharacterized protein BU26DRAFT_293097 [Trematosphaeria pertusa]KAF2249966.1 hypothetical protein BU26DRAFT_293097 [Trematosphaeria pertusa]
MNFYSSTLLILFAAISSVHGQDTVQLVTGCEDSDLTQANWQANDIDATISGTPGFGQGVANFPKAFIQNANSRVPFECADFAVFGQCGPVPDFFVVDGPGGDCNAFANSNPHIGFIANAWINIFNNLRNMNFAVVSAVGDISGSPFIEDIVNDATAEPLPIKRSVLITLAKLSLIFVPVPGAQAGAALNGFRTTVPLFKKLAGQALNQANPADLEQNIENQPAILRSLLGSIVPWVQNNMKAQNDDVFVTNHATGDTAIGDLLLGGNHMNTPPSEAEYRGFMNDNIKLYLLAQLWGNIGMNLVFADGEGLATCSGSGVVHSRGCARFRLPVIEGIKPTAAVGDAPRSLTAGIGRLGVSGVDAEGVINNILDCDEAGSSFENVDFEGFITSGGTGSLPACLFGIPVSRS